MNIHIWWNSSTTFRNSTYGN